MRGLALATTAAALAIGGSGIAWADFKVFTPDVNEGERAIETVGDFGSDPDKNKSGEQSDVAEVEYGLTSWWNAELEFEFERDAGPGQDMKFVQVTLENLFQFTERGEYWIDSGFFFEYGHAIQDKEPDSIEFGPVLRKDFWGLSNTVNLFVEKEIGPNSSGRFGFNYAFESRVDAWLMKFCENRVTVEPGVQFYGEPGELGHFAGWDNQDNRAGPQLFGKIYNIGPGTLEWNAGVLFGLTDAAPRITPRWQLEYEIRF